uniref:Protein TsetseEP domain-containing protein n=1 Tax=Anopheles epiroticus TaxID=199890 RepID=A0A182P226_9DIPT
MESLRYICWVVCLAQIAMVSGKPEFGTNLQFPVTPTFNELVMELSNFFGAFDDELYFMLSNQIPNSDSQQLLLAGFADDLSPKLRDISAELATAASSMYDVNGTLNAVLDKFAVVSDFYNTNANAFIASVNTQIGQYVSNELGNALVFIERVLPAVADTVDRFRIALLSAYTVQDVPAGVLRELIEALRNLKAHLPLLVYVFQRVGLNIQTADLYMATFKNHQQALPNAFSMQVNAFNANLDSLETAIGAKFSAAETNFINTGMRLSTGLTGKIQMQNNFAQIKSGLQAFASSRSVFLNNLGESIRLVSMSNRQSIATIVGGIYYDDENKPIDKAALSLSELLIESSPLAEFCHSKFAALVKDLPELGQIRLNECFDTELPRLSKLQKMIETYTRLVSFDVEDLWHNLRPCRNEFAAKTCLSKIATFYQQLAGARDLNSASRASNFLTLALNSIAGRIEFCLDRANIITFLDLVPSYIEDAASCVQTMSMEITEP